MSDKIQDSIVQYDDSIEAGGCGDPLYTDGKNNATANECIVNLTIDTRIEAPIYVYYQLENFYQNHRRYVKSRSNSQLLGEDLPEADLKDCDPIITNKQLQFTESIEKSGDGWKALDPEAPAFPCGLVAKSFFNDTFQIYKSQDYTAENNITIDDSNIAWKSDVENKFKNMDVTDWRSKQWMDVTNCKYFL